MVYVGHPHQRSVFEIFQSSMVALVQSSRFPSRSLECACLSWSSYLCPLIPITARSGHLGLWYP